MQCETERCLHYLWKIVVRLPLYNYSEGRWHEWPDHAMRSYLYISWRICIPSSWKKKLNEMSCWNETLFTSFEFYLLYIDYACIDHFFLMLFERQLQIRGQSYIRSMTYLYYQISKYFLSDMLKYRIMKSSFSSENFIELNLR